MVITRKIYTIWYWQKFGDTQVRVGQTFENKNQEKAFLKKLKSGQHIGTTVKYFILDDDVA